MKKKLSFIIEIIGDDDYYQCFWLILKICYYEMPKIKKIENIKRKSHQ